jgi:hypothetical protein
VTAGGNLTAQINVTDRRRSAGERVRWNPEPPLRERTLDITSRSQLGRMPPSATAGEQHGHPINPGQAFTLGLVRRSSPPPP